MPIQPVIADVITPVIAGVTGGEGASVARAVKGWTGLENCAAPFIDLDHDGLPDIEQFNDGTIHITQDEDSVNIDINNDGDADVVIPK